MPDLKAVPYTPPPPAETVRQRIKAGPKPELMLECRCGGREFIETRTGVMLSLGKPRGGTKQLVCVACLQRGERVVVL